MIACQEPTVQLKPRQRDALAAVMEALERGVTRQLVQLPTGVGKTILACEIARRFDRVLFLAHRDELVSQTIGAFGRVDPQRGIGVLGGRRHEVGYPITIGTIQTVHARLSRMDPAGYDLLVIDECFPAGTLVDGRTIESLRVGDPVSAFDDARGQFVTRRITRIFRRPAPHSLVRITTGQGELVCTANHPLWTQRGWVAAGDVVAGDGLLKVAGHAGCGQTARRASVWARVDGVEVLQRGGTGGPDSLCPDGLVYNIEVDGVHTYTANGFVVHNCHHAGARTWREVCDHFEPRLRLGLSATPERMDGAPLSNLFDRITYAMSVSEAVDEGYCCRPVGLRVRTGVDISKVKTTAGDYNEGQLGRAVDIRERNRLVAQTYVERCQGRRAVVFGVTVAHCQAMAETFSGMGVRAAAVWGDDPDRARKVADLAAGRLDVLTNAMLLTEGWDDPAVGAVLMARPTASRVLYTQAVGRGLRVLAGKSDCLIVDFVDNAAKNSLVGMFDFVGRKMRAKGDGTVDLMGAVDEEQERVAEAFEDLFGDEITWQVYAEEVDLLKPPPEAPGDAWSYGDYRWHYDPATERQLAALARLGYDVDGSDFTKGQASQMLSAAPASEAQLKLLFALGYDVLGKSWTRTQAGAALDNNTSSPDWNRARRMAVRR